MATPPFQCLGQRLWSYPDSSLFLTSYLVHQQITLGLLSNYIPNMITSCSILCQHSGPSRYPHCPDYCNSSNWSPGSSLTFAAIPSCLSDQSIVNIAAGLFFFLNVSQIIYNLTQSLPHLLCPQSLHSCHTAFLAFS